MVIFHLWRGSLPSQCYHCYLHGFLILFLVDRLPANAVHGSDVAGGPWWRGRVGKFKEEAVEIISW